VVLAGTGKLLIMSNMACKLIVFHKREKKLFRLCDTHYLLWTFMDTAKISNKSSIDFG